MSGEGLISGAGERRGKGNETTKFVAHVLGGAVRLLVVLVTDTVIISAWLFTSHFLIYLAKRLAVDGEHDVALVVLRAVGPWFFATFGILNLLVDLYLEVLRHWRTIRGTQNRNAHDHGT